MSFITKKLEELNELKILRLLNDKDPIYGEENRLAKLELKSFLSTALDEMIKEVEKVLDGGIVVKKETCKWDDDVISLIKNVADTVLLRIKQSLSSLREGNK